MELNEFATSNHQSQFLVVPEIDLPKFFFHQKLFCLWFAKEYVEEYVANIMHKQIATVASSYIAMILRLGHVHVPFLISPRRPDE